MQLTTFDNNASKSFWDKKEGKAGMVLLALLGVGVAYGLFVLLPFILILLQNMIATIALGVVLVILYLIVTNRRNQIAMMALLQVMSRWFAEWVTDIDPIAILENHIEWLGKNLTKMSQKLDLLRGQEVKLREKIKKNDREKVARLENAQAAKNKLGTLQPQTKIWYEVDKSMKLDANRAARLDQSNARLADTLNKIAGLAGTMERIYQHSDFIFLDTKSNIELMKEERLAIETGHSAFKSALMVLEGDADRRAMYDMAIDNIATQMGNQIGEIERFLDRSGSFLTSMDIEREVFDEKSLKMLEEFTKNENKFLIPQIDKNNLTAPLQQNNTVNTKQTVAVSSTVNKYIS